jgi:hypothetical protein
VAVKEHVTRQFTGHREDGSTVYDVTRHGNPARPESVAGFTEQRLASLGPAARTLPAGRVVVALLEAGEDGAAVSAAVALGEGLDTYQRHSVHKTLAKQREAAQDSYPPGARLMGALLAAWAARWGSAEPPRVA